MKGRPSKENLDKYCDYHGDKGHLANDCFNLKEQLRKALENGKLDHLVKDIRQRDGAARRDDTQTNKGRIINMVCRQQSQRKRKTTEQEEN